MCIYIHIKHTPVRGSSRELPVAITLIFFLTGKTFVNVKNILKSFLKGTHLSDKTFYLKVQKL